MLRVSITSFVLAIAAMASGLLGTAGVSFELGRLLFLLLLGIADVTFAWALLRRPAARQNAGEIPP